MKIYRLSLSLLFAGLVSFPLYACEREATKDPSTALLVAKKGLSLEPYLFLIHDKEENLTAEDVLKKYQKSSKFQKNQSTNLGFIQGNLWISFSVTNHSEIVKRWLLELNYPLMDEIDIYRLSPKGPEKIKSIHNNTPFPSRNFYTTSYIFPISPNTKIPTTYILRFKTKGTMRFPLFIWEESAYFVKNNFIQMLNFIYTGIFLAMFLFYLLSFFYTREKTIIYFFAFLIPYVLFQNIQNGMLFHILRPDSITWKYYFFCYTGLTAFLFAGFFAVNFLHLKKTFKTGLRIIQLNIIAVIIFSLLIPILDISTALKVCGIIGLLTCITELLIAFAALASGYQPARLFMVAWLFFLVSVSLFIFRGFGLLPNSFFTLHSMQIGSAFVILLLALAIADRDYINNRTKERIRNEVMLKEKEARIAQEEMVSQLQRLDRLKDEFLANTSHELKTPLHGIIGLADSILDGIAGEISPKLKKNVSMISESGRRLNSLVNDILDYAKIKSESIPLKLTGVDLKTVADTCFELLNPMIKSSPINLINNITGKIPPVMADENRLLQILYNLAGNAVKFSQKGNITIDADYQENKDKIRISITDEGIGIAADKLKDIFLPFQQGDGSMARNYGGTGLGLSITRRLVELHGSEIEVSSKEGFGSTFSFHLALADSISGNESPSMAKIDSINFHTSKVMMEDGENDIPTSGKHLILIADDDPVSLHVVTSILKKEGNAILQAEDGAQVIKKIEEGPLPDMLLLDIMMPHMSGYEVTRKVRQRYSMINIPIMLLTAKSRSEDLVLGFEAGANDFLTKPVNREELTARVKTLLTMKDALNDCKKLHFIERDLEVARSIQQSNIPATVPKLKSFNIAARYVPLDEVAGDFYDFYPVSDNALGILVTDVSGHGIASALIASMIKIVSFMQHGNASEADVVMSNMRQILDSAIEHQFVTAIYAYLDTSTGNLAVSRAGHDAALLYRKSENNISQIMPGGKMIGFNLKDQVNEVINCSIEKGDRLILYTDCAFEAMNYRGETFGRENFIESIHSTKDLSPDEAIEAIINSLYQWTGSNRLQDDLTLILVDILD